MGQVARVVAPGKPHHVIQRDNRRQATFFRDEDYGVSIHLMAQWCHTFNVEIRAYCLMRNHVHLVAVPEPEDGLAKAMREAHRRYKRYVNFSEGWRGHLWQGRFKSYVMDESYLLAAPGDGRRLARIPQQWDRIGRRRDLASSRTNR